MDLISVIVPVYKVEEYLDRCVQSIVDQTYRNLEIILVDDGSPDNCGAMCDAWAAKDSRIRVIHKENGGLSDARNAGMAVASGAYMGFVDSDDYISSDMYQLLYDRMIADDADIAACGVEMVFEDGTSSRMLTKTGSTVLDNAQAMEAVIRENWLKQPVWYKLYKTELIRDILFPVGKYHEDVFWTWQVVARAERISVFDTPCYFYVQRIGSIMSEAYSEKRLDALDAKLERIEYLQENLSCLMSIARIDLWYTCLYMGQKVLQYAKDDQYRIVEKLDAIAKQYMLTNIDISRLSMQQRVWAILSKLSYVATCELRNCLRIGI